MFRLRQRVVTKNEINKKHFCNRVREDKDCKSDDDIFASFEPFYLHLSGFKCKSIHVEKSFCISVVNRSGTVWWLKKCKTIFHCQTRRNNREIKKVLFIIFSLKSLNIIDDFKIKCYMTRTTLIIDVNSAIVFSESKMSFYVWN